MEGITSLNPFKGIKKREMRTIHITSTHYKFINPCETCGKEEGIIAGVPTEIDITLPMTGEEYFRASQKMFWIAIDFEIACVNGISHVAKGLSPKKQFIVSDEPGLRNGHYEEDESIEKVLHKFIPFLMEADRPRTLLGKF